MVKKLQKMSADKKSGPQLSSAVKDSAQQIWLAGLGAFSKAQQEGSKVFDTLVKEGLSIQRKTQATAEEKITQASSRMSDMASDIQSRAGNRWDKLETIFEERVAKALAKLGMPLAKDVQALAERVEQLGKRLQEMNGAGGSSAASQPKARAARKPAATSGAQPAAKAAAARKTPAAAKQPAARKTARTPAAKRETSRNASLDAASGAADSAA